MKNEITISVAKQFSKYPGGRFVTDGDSSGQGFRDELLAPALKTYDRVIVDLNGTLGYGSSFLEEAFGGLVRESGFDAKALLDKLEVRTDDDSLSYAIHRYISDAKAGVLV